jgi:2,4-dienoyl-CoA reductase-like NADH-dependent reductase (Old Yellow Enzyme family)
MTTDSTLERLFMPFNIRGLALRNRVVMSPMTRQLSPNGIPGGDVAEYYARRADLGLIITEGTWIDHPSASYDPNVPDFFGEPALAGWAAVVEAVHAAGGRIMPQLWHAGLIDMKTMDGSPLKVGKHVLGPSGMLGGFGRPVEKYGDPMPIEEIEKIIGAFGESAGNAYKLGFDGVALHGAHGYLIDQFLWKYTNLRDDFYGGDLIRRSNFAAEIVKACRRRTTADFPISFRISQWKLQGYDAVLGENPNELEAIIAPLVAAGVDMFDCSQRRFWEPAFKGSDLNLAGWVKKLTGLPTMTVGSVGLDAEMIESLGGGQVGHPVSIERVLNALDRGDFDLVGVGRAILADHQWLTKIKSGAHHTLLPFSRDLLSTLI